MTKANLSSNQKIFFQNKLAVAGMLLILFTSLVAVLGYLITPDGTPQANDMLVQLGLKKPGASFTILRIKKEDRTDTVNFISKMLFGQPSPWHNVPITHYRFNKDSIYVREYIGDEDVAAETAYNIYKISGKKSIADNPSTQDTKKEVLKEALPQVQKEITDQQIIKKTFWLGTDIYGRDMLSRLIIGARISLAVGFVSVLISLIVGVTVGSAAGYFGGKTDELLSWLMNVLWALPALLLVIAISFALGKGLWQIFVAVGLSMWVEVGRLVRGQVIALKQVEFIEAARALGFGHYRIIRHHILPNITGPILVLAASNFASAILLEAGLSFLGYGAQPPTPTWGAMIKEHYGYIVIDSAYLAILPGLAIMLIVYAFNVVTIGLRDAFDVKSQNTRI
ncbi:ABC transporter permease [uncultured Mucilaginibacter sp.]|uniref:ABC transporter permease n=1 Tax=uncultured Mucilaginibacter sp. TaxID=797541 RepID=UPI00262FD7E7|nr:ABC transporter permease [uncultured Mucilaginibacter sp.]